MNEEYSALPFSYFELCSLAPFFEASIGQESDGETKHVLEAAGLYLWHDFA